MKKISFLLLLLAAKCCYAQSPKEMAQVLLAKYETLADGSYKQQNQQKFNDSLTRYTEENFIGANRTEFLGYEDQLNFKLTYFRNNPQAEKTGKDIVKALKIIAKNKGYQLINFDADFYILYKGAEEIMRYQHETYMDIYPTEYSHFNITAGTPYSHYLAPETVSTDQLPRKLRPGKQPQVLFLPDSSKNRFIVMNGVFEKGTMLKGSFRISGYNEFMDGTWFSRRWSTNGASQVAFIPAGSTDTIIGSLSYMNFSNFEASWSLYFDQSLKVPKVPSSAAPWLRNVYQAVYTARKTQKQEEYEKEHLYDHTITYSQLLQQEQSAQNTNNIQNNNSAPAKTSAAPHSSFHKCNVCNGVGYTLYDCGQGGGHQCRKYCTACNGTGQVHN